MTGIPPVSIDSIPSPEPDSTSESDSVKTGSEADIASMLDAHKGKLAVGVAATLGLMIYYNLKKKKLPEEDPEGYARLLKLKDILRTEGGKKGGEGTHGKSRKERENPAATAPGYNDAADAIPVKNDPVDPVDSNPS